MMYCHFSSILHQFSAVEDPRQMHIYLTENSVTPLATWSHNFLHHSAIIFSSLINGPSPNFQHIHCEFSAMKKLPFTATILVCRPKNSVFKNPPFAWNYLQRNSPYATIYSTIHPWRFTNSSPLSPLSRYKSHPWRFYMQGHWNQVISIHKVAAHSPSKSKC